MRTWCSSKNAAYQTYTTEQHRKTTNDIPDYTTNDHRSLSSGVSGVYTLQMFQNTEQTTIQVGVLVWLLIPIEVIQL